MSNMKGNKHQAGISSANSAVPICDFMEAERTSSRNTSVSTASKQTTLHVLAKNEVLRAEILWALKIMNSHYSFKSSEDTSCLFATMFLDSKIAAKFNCGESKCAYVCTFGIAPHFKRLLLSEVSQQMATNAI